MRRACFVGVTLLASLFASAALASATDDGNAGVDALHRGDYDQAIRLFTRALASGTMSSDDREFAYSQRGTAYLDKGDYTAAIADLQRAVRLKPDDEDAQHQLELARSHGGGASGGSMRRGGGAARAGEDANAGADALTRGDYADAIALFSRAIDSGGLNTSDMELAYLSRGKAYMQSGDDARAIPDLNRALHINNNDEEVQTLFGQALTGLHARTAIAPISAATCTANFSSTGSWMAGKTYTAWASYPGLSTTDAFAGAYAFLAKGGGSATGTPWAVSQADLDQGTISATEPVPGGAQSIAIDVKVEPEGAGSRTSLAVTVGGMVMTFDLKGAMCNMLAQVSRG